VLWLQTASQSGAIQIVLFGKRTEPAPPPPQRPPLSPEFNRPYSGIKTPVIPAHVPQPQSAEGERPYLRYFLIQGQDPAQVVDRIQDDQLDELPYGAILLSNDAKILRYNRAEAEMTGRDQIGVKGHNFFIELAVCGLGPHFQGRYKQALLAAQYDEIFPYVFHYQMPETVMLVRITSGPVINGTRTVWVFVRRMMPAA
jgi:photoactive yellow protein